MNPEKDLAAFITTRARTFNARLNAEPVLFKRLALDVAERALELEKKYPNKSSKYQQAATEIFAVMGKGVGILQQFAAALETTDVSLIAPGKFFATVDALPDVDVTQSQEIIVAISEALQGAENGGHTFTEIFYENYLGEYLANIFNVSTIEALHEDAGLFAASRVLVHPGEQNVALFQIFGDADDLIKTNIDDTYYSFAEMQAELEK